MSGAHAPAVVFDAVTVRYADSPAPALRSASFVVEEGELAVVAGRTGAGKSTLLGAVNGTVPHFTGGHLSGRVTVAGLDTRTHRPRDLADVVGVVRQDPLAGFVTDTVEEELAYTLEQLAVAPTAMRRRVEEVLDVLGIADLRDAPLSDLSGGQQQRVAIGSVLTAGPRVLVLDEPTSALDPAGAEEVLATLSRLVHDLGLTVVVSEHRLERIVGLADHLLLVHDDGTVTDGEPAALLATAPLAPPVVHLGRWAGWDPLPLTVRAARREARDLRTALETSTPPPGPAVPAPPAAAPVLLEGLGISVRHGDVTAVDGIDLGLAGGEVVALMGRNGSGKSSLLWALHGTGPRSAGAVEVRAGDTTVDPSRESPAQRRRHVGLVPQSAGDLLYLATVDAECRQADHEARAPAGTARGHLDRLAPGIPGDRHPRDLSEGQRLALVVAVQLTAAPDVLLLDEPTRGLDYPAKEALTRLLRRLAEDGAAVLVATHDVEFAAGVADRAVVMAGGAVVADGRARDVLCDSPAFAPQVAKVLSPQRLLTVAEVRRAFAAPPSADGARDLGGAGGGAGGSAPYPVLGGRR
ncbi:ABC transporter ATP-binding protein [Pedococcus ginsenosidimutans]|uniref:ABC transporter ATP-binding protein n=1 Tax=Pedococcus ginsenosidimutans TaxID=490570 RepID=A0ABP8YMN4_9MICO